MDGRNKFIDAYRSGAKAFNKFFRFSNGTFQVIEFLFSSLYLIKKKHYHEDHTVV